MYVKLLDMVRRQEAAGHELWAQLDMVDQIICHMGKRAGPVWEGLVSQIVAAQKGVPVSLGAELAWVWTPGMQMIDTPLSWRNIMAQSDGQRDVTIRMLWEKEVSEVTTVRMKARMEERGTDLWDWYIVPEGSLDSAFGGRWAQWVDGVGAKKMCLLPVAAIGKKEVAGELWYIGGEQAYGTIEWRPLDLGGRHG